MKEDRDVKENRDAGEDRHMREDSLVIAAWTVATTLDYLKNLLL